MLCSTDSLSSVLRLHCSVEKIRGLGKLDAFEQEKLQAAIKRGIEFAQKFEM